jgi:hypothetical protein
LRESEEEAVPRVRHVLLADGGTEGFAATVRVYADGKPDGVDRAGLPIEAAQGDAAENQMRVLALQRADVPASEALGDDFRVVGKHGEFESGSEESRRGPSGTVESERRMVDFEQGLLDAAASREVIVDEKLRGSRASHVQPGTRTLRDEDGGGWFGERAVTCIVGAQTVLDRDVECMGPTNTRVCARRLD